MIGQLTLICFPIYQEITIASNVTWFFAKAIHSLEKTEEVQHFLFIFQVSRLYMELEIYITSKKSHALQTFNNPCLLILLKSLLIGIHCFKGK